MKKNKGKKRKVFKKLFLVIFLLLALSFALILLIGYVFDIKTKAVIISGNKLISDKEVLDIIDLRDYPNFILANTNMYEKKLKENNLIEKAKIKRSLNFRFYIEIKEKKPLFIRGFLKFILHILLSVFYDLGDAVFLKLLLQFVWYAHE